MIFGLQDCGPRISTHTFFTWWWAQFLFKNDLELPLIFVLFLKGKQNKKEKP